MPAAHALRSDQHFKAYPVTAVFLFHMRRHYILTFSLDNPCISDSSKSLVIFKTQTMCDYDYDYDSLQDFTLLSQSRTTLNFSFSAMVK